MEEKQFEIIPMKKFGKDHWSLLAYIEYRVMNHNGVLDKAQLRIKNPALQNTGQTFTMTQDWKPEYGSRLFGYWNKDKSKNKELLISNHDDYDCLDDLEKAKLVKSFGTGLNPAYKLTKFGSKVMGELTLHKQDGKNFAEFVFSKKGEKE